CHTHISVVRERVFNRQVPLLGVRKPVGVKSTIIRHAGKVSALAVQEAGINKGRAREVLRQALAEQKSRAQPIISARECLVDAETVLGDLSAPSGVEGLRVENTIAAADNGLFTPGVSDSDAWREAFIPLMLRSATAEA